MTTPAAVADGRGDPFRRGPWPRVAAVALVLYVIYACAQMEISWERLLTGLDNGARFLGRLFPPNFSRGDLLVKGLLESLQIAVLASDLQHVPGVIQHFFVRRSFDLVPLDPGSV